MERYATRTSEPHESDIIPFPPPVIQPGRRRRERVLIEPGKPLEEKIILQLGESNFFEIGRHLRDTIYGYVYLAVEIIPQDDGTFRRTSPRRDIALKVYNKEKMRQIRHVSQENPIAEFAAMQFIGYHPNVMSLLGVCEDVSTYNLLMDYIDGGELLDLIFENPMSEPVARIYIRQILSGLLHLHSAGLAHRDISLENVLFSHHGYECKIIDFGMTVRVPYNEELQRYSRVLPRICGKRNYMAPEVVQNSHPYNPQLCDIWAIGIMIFIMITGYPLVELARSDDSRFVMLATGRLPLLLERWGVTMSPQAMDIIQYILRPIPEERPSIPEILEHPWLNPPISDDRPPSISQKK